MKCPHVLTHSFSFSFSFHIYINIYARKKPLKSNRKKWIYSVIFFMYCIAGLMPIHWLKNRKMPWKTGPTTEEKWKKTHRKDSNKSLNSSEMENIFRSKEIANKKNCSYTRHHSASIFFWLFNGLLFLSIRWLFCLRFIRHSIQFNLSIFICNS